MSDSDLTQKTNFTQNQNTGSTKNLKDQVADAGAEIKQRAGDALRASTDVARDKFKEAADAAKDVASGTVDQLQEQTRQQQRTGADFVERFAGNIREAARAFESEAPFAAVREQLGLELTPAKRSIGRCERREGENGERSGRHAPSGARRQSRPGNATCSSRTPSTSAPPS